ncbi:hypothetical protein QN277_004702 [Acacia crassicarpa]|uniref:MATH domain-containing protein n=1 Tax=Acacia crassicarpa TaxID=499986 RepID=A0AAE1MIN2_9FABA|nr:hypothetical protein QN277_004702 [Acacia crassicarpa]
MKNQEPKDTCKKLVWTINNFSTLNTNLRHCSEVFIAGGCAWKVVLYRGGKDGNYLGIYLEVADGSSLPQGWSISAACKLTVVNQTSIEKSEKQDFHRKFCADNRDWGFGSFMELAKLQNPDDGYILNDKCIVEVELSEINSEGSQVVGQIEDEDAAVEFKDLGKIEKPFVPLLEEICSWHPSLLDCKKIKSRRFTEWAFTALGRVLQFLRNKKLKDMNKEACEELQQLWEELEMSRLDLSWLEPLVKSALSMKGYLEKAMQVKKLRQDLVLLEKEMNKIKVNLADTELTIEITKTDLILAEEGFEEKDLDLDSDIGYAGPSLLPLKNEEKDIPSVC